ncbi:MAG: hypothetical protein LJE65_09465 [Desulfobacteraceae bacterium]|nr:hypothetical protein [Desulfobacteraceae bacterium]
MSDAEPEAPIYHLKTPRRKQRGMFCLSAVLRSPVRNSPYLDSLANPAASCGDCARCCRFIFEQYPTALERLNDETLQMTFACEE